MPTCPRCHQTVDSQAVSCPYCRTQLKAFGHPGIPLHRTTGKEPLCETCTYHLDDSCTYPQRPYATECTLYQNIGQKRLEEEQRQKSRSPAVGLQNWLKRNQSLLLILGLLLVCFLIALSHV